MQWRTNPSGGALGKLSSSWQHAVYLGVSGKSGEIIVTDGKGVWKTRTIQRKPKDERWLQANSDIVMVHPWTTKEEKSENKEPVVAIRLEKDEMESKKQARGWK